MDTDLEQRLSRLEERIKSVETDRDRFLSALRQAVGEILKNPLALAAIPRAMKEDLKRYVAEDN